MRFTPRATWLALMLSLPATALLTACGSGGDGGGDTQVRLLNATRSYPSLDLTVNDKTINSKVAYATVGEYGAVNIDATATKVLTSDVGTSIAATTPSLTAGSNYTYITYGFAGAVRTTLLQEAETVPDANKAKLLVLNLAPDAGAMDVYLTTAADCALATETALTSNLQGGAGSGYIQVNSGTFRVCVTGYNKRAQDLRLNIPAVTLDSATVNTLILTSTDGGVLVNGITLVQKGAVKNYASTQARVRTVNALSNSATVSATVNGQQMFDGAISPLISDYVTVESGASTLSVQVNGNSVSYTPPTFTAGTDTTLLVYGDPAAPKLSVLNDDNRLPTVSGDVKIRLINAMPISGAGLNVGFGAVASNVASGATSVPATTSSSSSTQVDVTAPIAGSPIYTNTAFPLPANTVWTFIAVPTVMSTTNTTGYTALPKRERP
ncbi:MAG: DUF4397 domain-containing protein [Roseateles sp.]|uniref:DUF4397 domain-containing protein n=1 Tax=Roseateles sp. TaxID=1971397 RepID=UPI0039EA1D00